MQFTNTIFQMEYSTSAPNERVWRITQPAKLGFNHPSVVLTADVSQFLIKNYVANHSQVRFLICIALLSIFVSGSVLYFCRLSLTDSILHLRCFVLLGSVFASTGTDLLGHFVRVHPTPCVPAWWLIVSYSRLLPVRAHINVIRDAFYI